MVFIGIFRDWVTEMEIFFVWLRMTFIGTSKDGKCEIIEMVQSSGHFGDREEQDD